MKRHNILLLLATLVLLAGGILLVLRREEGRAPEHGGSTAALSTATPQPTATPAPASPVIAGTSAPGIEAPTSPIPTAVPTAIPTAVPTAAPAPSPTPTPSPVYEREGSFRSDTGTWLNIIVRWKILGSGENTQLQLDVYVESFTLDTYQRVNDVVFTVNGKTLYDSSGPIHVDSNTVFVETLLGSAAVDVPSGRNSSVTVSWLYRGVYSNREIDSVTAQETIYIP